VKLDKSFSEADFTRLVTSAAASGNFGLLVELLDEDHPVYCQRSSSTIVSMRGWVLLSIARTGLADEQLIFVLEELETGVDPYLIAAAAFTLRTFRHRDPLFARYLINALNNIRFNDEPVELGSFGGYDIEEIYTTPVNELLLTFEWLGSAARIVLPELIELCRGPGGFKGKVRRRVEAIVGTIDETPADEGVSEHCCNLGSLIGRVNSYCSDSRSAPDSSAVFEDQSGKTISFEEFFLGRPSIIVFFYTRCDNPLKCSLTITKLARIQRRLQEEGYSGDINLGGITYDGEFDIAQRLERYGADRGFRPDSRGRLFRTTAGFDDLRKHFELHVNFVESIINRHTVACYILDSNGRVVRTFERHLWDENEVMKVAIQVLESGDRKQLSSGDRRTFTAWGRIFGFLATIAFALFPKCPICWAAYLGLFGLGGTVPIPHAPWLLPVLVLFMVINIGAVWLRAKATGRMAGFYITSAGATVIVLAKLELIQNTMAIAGMVFTICGALLSVSVPSFRWRLNTEQKLTRI